MITTTQDFDNWSAFERNVLATVFPLVDEQQARASLNLRDGSQRIQLQSIDDIGQRSRDLLVHELRPLLFGAAWKVVDLLIEFGLNQTAAKAKWPIAEKASKAANLKAPVPFSDADIWSRVAAIYASTVEVRHSLAHRRFCFQPNGDMTGITDTKGNALLDVTAAEQVAFCRLSQRLAGALHLGILSNRHRLDLIALVDALQRHHSLGPLNSGAPARLPEVVRVDAVHSAAGWTVDTARAESAAKSVFPNRPYLDIEIAFPNSGLPPLRGRLEDAQIGSAIAVDPQSPPNWIDR